MIEEKARRILEYHKPCAYCYSIFILNNAMLKYCSMECCIHDSYIINSETKCWMWQRSFDKHKKPCFSYKGKIFTTIRTIYQLYTGEISTKFRIRHKCDQDHCINPDHLYLIPIDKNNSNILYINAKKGLTIITDDIAIAIINDPRPYPEIAKEYKLHRSTVSKIRTGKIKPELEHLPRKIRKGPLNVPSSKLNEYKIRKIRKENKSLKEIAKKYCVSTSTIRSILCGRTWSSVK